ncbi:MAG: hypothetical protein R3361_07950, partial [Aequorivita vladivostokensis]|nr:hypothetical protein [Aequorivita vladivostokensis]
MQTHFTINYTASLADIPAREKALQENGNCGTMTDSFGRILKTSCVQQDLFGDSLKTSPDTYRDLSPMFWTAYEQWVTKLKQDYTARKKQARRIKENACLSSPWMTPQTVDSGTSREPRIKSGKRDPEKVGNWRMDLKDQVNNLWTTPVATDMNRSTKYKQGGTALSMQVKKNFPTPTANDHKGCGNNNTGRDRLDYAVEKGLVKNGQLDPKNNNTNGKPKGQLNPEWVAQLMGTTLEQSFFASLATALFPKPQKSPL